MKSQFQIALVSPSEVDYEESICTLRYASRVKYIKNQVRINVETKKGLIECFEQEIAKLQERISVITMYEEKAAVKMVIMKIMNLMHYISINFRGKVKISRKLKQLQKSVGKRMKNFKRQSKFCFKI